MARLRASGPQWLRSCSLGGISRLLRRLGIAWKRAREHIRSPDAAYAAKLQRRDGCLAQAAAVAGVASWLRQPRWTVTLLQDELTFYRQPTLAAAYAASGHDQARAELAYQSNTTTRVAATLDVVDGRVVSRIRPKLGIAELVAFYQQVCAAYPAAERIYVVQDNWSIHHHPDVLAALEPQEQPWGWHRPAHWGDVPSPEALRRWGHWHLPIQLVPLPTYASWLNPIEKLWRWLKQQVLHLHRCATDLATLRGQVQQFLDQFAAGSPALLRYTGLEGILIKL